MFLKVASDFFKTLFETKNLANALEAVTNDLIDFFVASFNDKVISQLIPELVKSILENPEVPSFLQTPQVEAIVTEFLASLYENRHILDAFDAIENDTLSLLYSNFMANPNVPPDGSVPPVVLFLIPTIKVLTNPKFGFPRTPNFNLAGRAGSNWFSIW